MHNAVQVNQQQRLTGSVQCYTRSCSLSSRRQTNAARQAITKVCRVMYSCPSPSKQTTHRPAAPGAVACRMC